jgi:hypothetical protein
LATAAEYRLGYSIPQIDISQQKAFQVEVGRSAQQYYGHPTTAMLEGGKTIFVVYPSQHAAGRLFLKRSDDGGLTWSVPEMMSCSDDVHLCEPGAVTSPDGQQIAVLWRNNRRKGTHTLRSPTTKARRGRGRSKFRTGFSPASGMWPSTFPAAACSSPSATWPRSRPRAATEWRACDCAYPGVEVLPDGTVVTVTYGKWDTRASNLHPVCASEGAGKDCRPGRHRRGAVELTQR